MTLSAPISPDVPLVVSATEQEVAELVTDWPILVTGVGKLRCAFALMDALREVRPSGLVNIGTAGALRDGWSGTHVVRRVLQHDFDEELVARLVGQPVEGPIDLAAEGPVLATGDEFVNSTERRLALARVADLVDMEGYVVAAVARRMGLPATLIKHVSDQADEGAGSSWVAGLGANAKALAHAAGWASRGESGGGSD